MRLTLSPSDQRIKIARFRYTMPARSRGLVRWNGAMIHSRLVGTVKSGMLSLLYICAMLTGNYNPLVAAQLGGQPVREAWMRR